MHRRFPFVPVAAALLAAPASAQPAAPITVGELLYNGADQKVRVQQCRAVAYGRECEVVLWENGQAASNPSWWAEADLIQGDARVRAALGRPPRAGATGGAGAVRTAATAPARPVPARPPAGGTGVPDGIYRCQLWMGNSYVDLGNVRSVRGALSPNPLAKAGATITGVAPSASGITISYTTARGYRESMDCARR